MKVTGALPGVTGGVSQLPPGDRQPGQCEEQINFLSDRTRGLARRHGSLWQGERSLGAQPAASFTDAARWRTAPWRTAGGEYTALVRTAAVEPGCTLPGLQVYRHSDKSFLPIVRGVDADLDALFSGGCSSVTSVGAYLFMAGNTTVPRGSSTDAVMGPAFKDRSAVWIRGGAYSREYTVTVKRTSGDVTAKYKTPTAEYPGTLDTGGIPSYVPDASGDEPISYTSSILPQPATGVLFLPGNNQSISNLQVWDADGAALTLGSSPAPVLPSEFYSTQIGDKNVVVLYAASTGRSYSVKFDMFIEASGETVTVTANLTAEVGTQLGYAYLPYPLLYPMHPVVCAGYTHITSGTPTSSELLYLNGLGNYAYFAFTEVGKSVTISGRRSKVVANPDYQRLVDDAKLNYERQVTAWMIASAAKVQPSYIAGKLASALANSGVTVAVFDSHIAITAESVAATDGGDGSLVRAVDQEVAAVEELSDLHYVGKTVRVRPLGQENSYYVKAKAKTEGRAGFTEVVWVEAPGVVSIVEHALFYALVAGGNCYVASTATKLAALVPGDHPEFSPSTAGDLVTSPLPTFIGKPITLLTTFQDRLIVGTGGTLCISAAADYLRFMPSSVLTVPADTAFEVSAQGSDTDTLRHAVLYGRDLLVFGEQKQYALSGKSSLTATGISLPVISTVPGAAKVAPVALGGLLLFATSGERGTAMSQMQPTQDPDNPSVTSVSAALSDYLSGQPVELSRRSNPDTVYLRTSGASSSVYQFRFEDSQRGREQASWYTWSFDPTLGTILGIMPTASGVLVFFLRESSGTAYLVADLCSEDAAQSTRPYTDSQRPLAQVLAGGSVSVTSSDSWVAAYTKDSVRYLIGDVISKLPELRTTYGDANLVIGCRQPTKYVMTNPYPRDKDGRPNRGARLTVTNVKVVAADSSGMVASVVTPTGTTTRTFLSRSVQDLGLIGRIPVGDWSQQVAIAKWNEGYSLTVEALRWYPLTITAIDWTGQLFQRAQRI